MLDGGHPDAPEQAADLLFDPLLVNYGGALWAWLECVVDKDPLGRGGAIRHTLDRARTLQTDIRSRFDAVELELSTHRRAQLHFMEAEEIQKHALLPHPINHVEDYQVSLDDQAGAVLHHAVPHEAQHGAGAG